MTKQEIRKAQMLNRLLELIRRNPGLSAMKLESLGWSPRMHGNFRDAEDAGLIVWDGGWYLASLRNRMAADGDLTNAR